jgi:hypothetical protein
MGFRDVKTILDQALVNFKNAHGHDADLSGHPMSGKPLFSWATAADLRNAWGKGVQLIQPEVVGKIPKQGQNANLVIDLTTGLGGKPRMPKGGPYLTPVDIQVIIDWIDGGCLDN